MKENFLTEEEIDDLVRQSNILSNHPEMIGTNFQLIELMKLNLQALRMDDEEKYPPMLILIILVTKLADKFHIEAMEILESIKDQIDYDYEN